MKRVGLVLAFFLLLNLSGILALDRAQAALNAAIETYDVPLSVYPGDVLAVSVTMRNTGDTSPADNWTYADPNYFRFRSISVPDNTWTTFAVNIDSGETITPSSTKTFTFYIIAPSASGTYAFTWQMAGSIGGVNNYFGEILDLDINVNETALPSHLATLVTDNIPLQLAPGELRYIEMTINNAGTSHWVNTIDPPYRPIYKLVSQNSPYDFWSTWYVNFESTDDIAPGDNKTFSFYVTAPETTGTYNFNWQMMVFTLNQAEIFFNQMFSRQIEVTNTVYPALDAELVSHTLPATLVPGETRAVTITMRNPTTATTSWYDYNGERLFSRNSPLELWGAFVAHLSQGELIPPGQEKTFSLTLTAPLTSGTYSCNWGMAVASATGPMFFGDAVLHNITVGEECSNGESRLCPNQNGVCSGSEEVCAGSQWPGCNYTTIPGYEAIEATCNDALDNDCDGLTDIADADCSVATEICNNLADDDGDLLIDCADPDCNGQACNDDDACSTGESCSGGLCKGGVAITCNDFNICTDNHCNPESGCYYTNNTAPCNDGLFCNGADTCASGSCSAHSGNPCQGGGICNETADACTECDADDDCDGVCNPGASAPECSGLDNCPLNPNAGQEDSYPPDGNGIGNACDCEGNFNCDADVDGQDAFLFKTDFGRSILVNRCTAIAPCNGDFNCDGDVDGADAFILKTDFGRSTFINPCPACVVGAWCSY
jgi:hypothetical protein